MTRPKSKKLQITEAVLAELPSNVVDLELNVDQVLMRWWATGKQDGLRLTEYGNNAFVLAKIQYFDFEFTPKTQGWHGFLRDMSRKIKCPYYMGSKRVDGGRKPYIRMYDSKIAMMVELYGDIISYLESIRTR